VSSVRLTVIRSFQGSRTTARARPTSLKRLSDNCHMVPGHLKLNNVLGGQLKLDRQRSVGALKAQIADPLGLSVEDGSAGVIELFDSNLRDYTRAMILRRLQPRELRVLLPWRGASKWTFAGIHQDPRPPAIGDQHSTEQGEQAHGIGRVGFFLENAVHQAHAHTDEQQVGEPRPSPGDVKGAGAQHGDDRRDHRGAAYSGGSCWVPGW